MTWYFVRSIIFITIVLKTLEMVFLYGPQNTKEQSYSHMVDIAGHATNSIYNKDILTRLGGFNESIRCAEDYDLHLRMGEIGAREAVVGQCLVKHRCRPSPRTFSMEDLMENAYLLLRESVGRMSNTDLFLGDPFRKQLSLKFWHMARLLLHSRISCG